MNNPILKAVDEIGEAVTQMRQANDDRLEKLEKGDEVRAKELDIQADRWNRKIDIITNQLNDIKTAAEVEKSRIEMLEAMADRPKGTPTEQLEQKHLKTFEKFIRTGMKDSSLEAECHDLYNKELESKDVTIGTALAGGNAVPTILAREIERLILLQSEVVGKIKNVTAGSSDYNEIVTVAGENGGWVAETGSRTNSTTPLTRKATVTHGELYALPKVSNWSINDLFFNVERWLAEDNADTMAITLSTALFSGDGSDKPTGMTNSAPTAVADYNSPLRAAAVYEYIPVSNSPASSFNADDLIDLQYKLRAGYQTGAEWAMNSTTQGFVRKLKDSNNQYLWQPGLQLGQPNTLLGKAVFTWEDLGGATTADALPVAYGNFRRAYVLAKIGPMTMIVDNISAKGHTQFYTAQRYGGIPLNNDAIKWIKNAAT